MTPLICAFCEAALPDIGPVGQADWIRVVRALEGGSEFVATAELRLAQQCTEEQAQVWMQHLLCCARSWRFDPDQQAILQTIDAAYADAPRPVHFTTFEHCDECREHDETLASRTRWNIRRVDLGSTGWSPVGFCNAEGLKYYMPAFARYALMPDMLNVDGVGDGLIFLLAGEPGLALFDSANFVQREAVAGFLGCVRSPPVDRERLDAAIARWGPTKS